MCNREPGWTSERAECAGGEILWPERNGRKEARLPKDENLRGVLAPAFTYRLVNKCSQDEHIWDLMTLEFLINKHPGDGQLGCIPRDVTGPGQSLLDASQRTG